MARTLTPDFSGWRKPVHPDGIVVDNSLRYGELVMSSTGVFMSQETLDDYREWWHSSAVEMPDKKTREVILDEARKLTMGDRDEQYGSPHDHFSEVARVLTSYGYSGPGGRKMMPHDVPLFQIVVKLSRINKTPAKMDSWVDVSGYGACGGEVAEIEASVDE